MPAPRLLDKKIVSAELATQKKQQIDAGIAIAKKVDAVRETLQEEETNLESFRKNTISRVQKEIDEKIAEKRALEISNAILREDRVRLQAPIDLTKEWEEVRRDKQVNEEWQESLVNQEVSQIAKEGEIEKMSKKLAKQAGEIVRKETLAERTLQEAERKFEESSAMLDKAKADSKRLLDIAVAKEKQVVQREIDADDRDKSVLKREQEVNEHEIDLSNREQALKVRYETFAKAQAYINSKKK